MEVWIRISELLRHRRCYNFFPSGHRKKNWLEMYYYLVLLYVRSLLVIHTWAFLWRFDFVYLIYLGDGGAIALYSNPSALNWMRKYLLARDLHELRMAMRTYMSFAWDLHATCMRTCMKLAWHLHETCMGLKWNLRETCMRLAWNIHDDENAATIFKVLMRFCWEATCGCIHSNLSAVLTAFTPPWNQEQD